MPKFTSDEQLDQWFDFHPPSNPLIAGAHEEIREECRRLARVFSNTLPECLDKTVALRKVREAMFEANACIAVQQRVYKEES